MDFKGVWTVVSMKAFDMSSMEMVWKTIDQILLDQSEETRFYRMLACGAFVFEDESPLKIYCPVEGSDKIPEEEKKEAIESGHAQIIDGKLMMVQEMAWKEENGTLYVDNGEHGEILGEAIDPFKPVVVCGNTLIINDMYQICRKDDIPSEIKKTVKVVKEGTPEMKAAAGTYKGLYTRFVGDPEDSKNTSEPFVLTLNEDGTGSQHRNDLDIKIPDWTIENGTIKLTEKFLGTIDYTGTLSGTSLILYNGDPDNAFTCTYVYEKE